MHSWFLDIRTFGQTLAPGALVGIDPGTHTIGLSRSDSSRITAIVRPHYHRENHTIDIARLIQEARDVDAAGFVMGYPLNLDGSSGPRAQSTRALARALREASSQPVLLWDERLSTHAARRTGHGKSDMLDSAAACFILQGALDALGRTLNENTHVDNT